MSIIGLHSGAGLGMRCLDGSDSTVFLEWRSPMMGEVTVYGIGGLRCLVSRTLRSPKRTQKTVTMRSRPGGQVRDAGLCRR